MTKKTVLLKHLIIQADLVTVDDVEVTGLCTQDDGDWVSFDLANDERYYVLGDAEVEITGDVHPVQVDAVDYRHYEQEPEANWQMFTVTLQFFRRKIRLLNEHDFD